MRILKDVQAYNTTDFNEYLRRKSLQVFGTEYKPYGTVINETKLLGEVIGTKNKPGKYDKALIKKFIDIGFERYTPTKQYPTTSFGFLWNFKQEYLNEAQLILEQEKLAEESDKYDDDEVMDWIDNY